MSEVEMMTIEEHFPSQNNLVQKAAPGAVYFGREASLEAEYDDDSGYYLSKTIYYAGLFDQSKGELKIENAKAYEAFFEHVQELWCDEDDDSTSSQHVSALNMVLATGEADDIAIQILYQEHDLLKALSINGGPLSIGSALAVALENNDDSLVLDLLGYSQLDPYDIDRLLERDPDLWVSLIDQRRLQPEHLWKIYRHIKDTQDEDDIATISSHRRCPTDLLKEIVLEGRAEFLDDIARNPDEEDPLDDLLFVIHDIATSADTLLFLSEDGQEEVGLGLLSRPQLPDGILLKLAVDPSPEVRTAVVLHPQVTLEMLRLLAVDPDPDVRQAVADHPQATPDFLTNS